MASLDKLAIRGIRSFDDKSIALIEFFSPVTVIVGHNGSGKTTIIECLKYATTGDQPPNTRGGAFVHDPKIANEKEVKAQVKLRFFAANGTRMLAVRNLSVTAKKAGGLTMKTLEGILGLADANIEKGGKRGVISTKCAELDVEVPQLLGVSKSVLENVIFCHQEDSYWPLAEASVLKKKFDDIFEATKYTKALDNIKALRKDRMSDLKAEKERLESLRREKGHADKLKKGVSDMQTTIAQKEIEYEDAKRAYDAIVIANQKFYEQSSKFRDQFTKIEQLGKNIKLYQQQMAEAKSHLSIELSGSEAELKEERDGLGEKLDSQQAKLGRDKENLGRLEDQQTSLRHKRDQLVQQQARLKTMVQEQAQRIEDRDRLVADLADKHNLRGFTIPLDTTKYLEFKTRLDDLLAQQKSKVQQLKREEKAKQQEYTNKRLELSRVAEKFKADANSNRERIAETEVSIHTSEARAEKMESHALDLDTLRGDLEEKQQRVVKLRTALDAAKHDEQIADKTRKIQDLERKRDAANSELKALSSQGNSRAKLELKRNDIKAKNVDVKHTVEMINAKYKPIKNREVNADNVGSKVDTLFEDSEKELADAEKKAAAAQTRLQQAKAQSSTCTAQLKKAETELAASEKEMYSDDLLEGQSLQDAIKDTAEEYDWRQGSYGRSKVYEELLKVGTETHTCAVCSQKMNKDAFAAYRGYLKGKMDKDVPSEEAEEEKNNWKRVLDKLQALLPLDQKIKDIKDNVIPPLQEDVKRLETEMENLSRDVQEADGEVKRLKQQVRDAQNLQASAKNIAKLQKEIQRLNEETESLVQELSASGSTKTVEDVEVELDDIAGKIQTLDKERMNISKDKDRQTKVLHTVEGDVHKMELEERDLQAKIKEREDLATRVESMKKDIIIFQQKAKEAEAQFSKAQAPIDTLTAEWEISSKAMTTQMNEMQALAESLFQSVDKLNTSHSVIERHARGDYPGRLRAAEDSLSVTDEDVATCATDIARTREAVSDIERSIAGVDAQRANLQENIRIRQLESQIERDKAQIATYDLEEAERARKNFELQYSKDKDTENKLHGKCSHLRGEITSNQERLKESNKDMKEFKDVDQKYTDQLVKVKMSDVANNDLELYAKALDNAIMKYHGLKMEEVNSTMRHLWNRTYQGTDIDGIKIRSDVEGGASKRSYNYRVVMTKDQVEMDMRGRCSAGQKMLASIIIRLALSDSFGQNCGILALDEPTNALDRENIEALASSLVDIIEERKNQNNFQLIIITHDEEFLARLAQNNIMQHYWRVTRDNRQKSIIERQNLTV